MFKTQLQLRVRYAETDQMGVVYHANYATYFEVARTESIRGLGFTYRELETMGIEMPVVDIAMRYHRAACYDDLLTIHTEVRELPERQTMEFHHRILNESGKLVTSGHVTLFFIDKATKKRTRMPAEMLDRLRPFYIAGSGEESGKEGGE
jgi:acyl-CoA thioester hydrolase